ncbi:MAG: methyltransferase domain-containing protein [Phormidesmis sp. CAN_BIN44]|nr:methyltransferase domain-containing protein [Phormidesmis sp. CAN_BIN44]
MEQTWNSKTYAENARFVSDLGMPAVEWLAPQPSERILDLGCGDGALTVKLQNFGCEVIGVDSSRAGGLISLFSRHKGWG